MGSRTAHQQRNHQQRRKLNAVDNYSRNKERSWSADFLADRQSIREAQAAIVAFLLAPLMRRRKQE
jgi:hypothetical protein